MNHFFKLYLIGLIILTVASNAVNAQKEISKSNKPNVLVILTDQQSNNMLSCVGNEYLKTPNIDKLAAKGIRFDKTYSVCPVCAPTRFSLMTGHYPSSVGIKENDRTERPERFDSYEARVQQKYSFDIAKVETIKETYALGNIFRKAGYETLYAGKRHLWGDFSAYGFDSEVTNPYEKTALYAEQTLARIADENNQKPFLMFLSFMQPHDICWQHLESNEIPRGEVEYLRHFRELHKTLSRLEYQKQIPPRKTSYPISDEHPDMFSFVSQFRHWDQEWDFYNWIYHRLTEVADEQIGRVLNALEKYSLEENTIIIFTSDHGDMQGAHGLVWKNVLLEECQRVPLIVAGPGIKKNHVDDTTLVCNGLDFLPTVCDLAGITIPDDLPGVSLKPYITGVGNKKKRDYIITESFNAFQINNGRYKYTIYELPGHPETLTDLEMNPEETLNFAKNPEYNKLKMHLKNELMTDLSKRGLTPLPTDRQIEYIWPTRLVD